MKNFILQFIPKLSVLHKFSIFYKRFYEGFSYSFEINGEKKIIERLKSDNNVYIFDVGGHHGHWSLSANENFPKADIHIFEISRSNFKIIRKNVSHLKNVQLNDFGLSDKNDKIKFKNYGDGSTLNTIIEDSNFHDYNKKFYYDECHVVSGDSYCLKNDITEIDFLKIDVEGAEMSVLKGFNKMIDEKKIKLIQFEYGYANGDSHSLMKDFFKFFNQKDYVVGRLKPNGVDFSKFQYPFNNFESGPNYIAVRKSDSNLIKQLAKF